MDAPEIQRQVSDAIRHLLSEENRDPYAPAYGCFDRRHWGWKLVDYPEATFQRNVYPLAWQLKRGDPGEQASANTLIEAAQAGLVFAAHIQHRDGSFDQAFPHEHSFGATAFLLHPLLETYRFLRDCATPELLPAAELMLHRSAEFLCRRDEEHGHIANHLAGAVLSLLASAELFGEPRFQERADQLLDRILAHQSPEGWFLEYEGADPGYQTLCLYYLAQVYRLRPTPRLRTALERAISFLAWFVHPDGTFGGEYGSRRTALFYPGGLALLSREFPLANAISRFMLASITLGHTVTLRDVDTGNLAPLLANYLAVLEADEPAAGAEIPALPCEHEDVSQDFPQAGLYVRGTLRYYAIVGASNGGIVKVFDRQCTKLIWNDGGYVGQTDKGRFVTTQMTDVSRACTATGKEISIEAPFYEMLRSAPGPFQFLVLRLLNLTAMRSAYMRELIKRLLVGRLISGKRRVPFHLSRVVKFTTDHITVSDVVRANERVTLRWLEYGRPFVAIHMASARYFEGESGIATQAPIPVDVATLHPKAKIEQQVIV